MRTTIDSPHLDIVVYHYVRDLPRTRFPALKGMLITVFERQVRYLAEQYELATLESALAYLQGRYCPPKNLCLVTFDDGLKDHFLHVLPILREHRIQGVFLLPTGCLEQHHVVDVHKNQFLMAALGPDRYLAELSGQISGDRLRQVDAARAGAIYRWDSPEVAKLKFHLNFELSDGRRTELLSDLFLRFLGDEREFARRLYVSWEEARQMQRAGMLMGGHSHRHFVLSSLDESAQREDIATCAELLRWRLDRQPVWPFSYPHGVPDASFDAVTERVVLGEGFACAFSTETGANRCGHTWTRLRRHDANDIAA